jgi:hypothetical protein
LAATLDGSIMGGCNTVIVPRVDATLETQLSFFARVS